MQQYLDLMRHVRDMGEQTNANRHDQCVRLSNAF